MTRGLVLTGVLAAAYGVEMHLRQALQSLLQMLSLSH
jgi:hypothetical protein